MTNRFCIAALLLFVLAFASVPLVSFSAYAPRLDSIERIPGQSILWDSRNHKNVIQRSEPDGTATSIDYEHHEVHSGSAFSHTNFTDVTTGAGSNLDFLLRTGTGTCHLRFAYQTEGEFGIYLFEAVTYSATGTAAATWNRNRTSSASATMLIYSAPTITGTGTAQLRAYRTGSAGTVGGGDSPAHEWILKPSTNYLVRFNKVPAGTLYVSYRLWWYEE